MIKEVKKYCVLVLLIICAGIGVALTLKASIGVGAWDAMTTSIAVLIDVKIGTMGMILNCTCVLGQLLLLKKEFKIKQFLQIPVSILLGIVVNFILYEVLTGFTLENYYVRFIVFVLAIVIVALSVSSVMVLNVVTFAVEGLCMALSKKINKNFAMLRQGIDILSIVISLILTLVFSQKLILREGTIVGMLLFGPLIGIFMKLLEPVFKNLSLANENLN